ncbi:MAG: cytochrome C, partial [Gammaproteobacteria bacterium]|nr:cytochrome C [Gammaproteobacteria bacterium]
LGMHCGDFDTRISSILPPFNVLHAQVIRKGEDPEILDEDDGISVQYSASSNPFDPILSGLSPSGEPLLSSVTAGNVYKTNFWDAATGSTDSIALKAYRPFYPPGVLDAFSPVVDQGLPMPDVERLYLGDGELAADQQSMPGISTPYVANDGQHFGQYVGSMPFFLRFDFGYTALDVNWFEAAGIPVAAFDDFGRENPYPLFRVQVQDASGNTLASVDTVAPISGEANCQGCHGAPVDGGNGSATHNMTTVATTLDDPQLGEIPLVVSKEYAADINILRLHDQEHGTMLEGSAPVVCQTCHYTPALDLAQVGPLGPENDPANANGRDQAKNKSMSNVMHSHHATVTDESGAKLFPSMPPPVDASGKLRNPNTADDILQQTCYQCHPGRRTDCLRGAMATGCMLCQDCHGDMQQVGNDFSRNVDSDNVGAFEIHDDFYTNPETPRVPWANEPGCGSCHTGDAMDNMHGDAGTIGSVSDKIRLMQTWLIDDAKATPIVPTNKRFAEDTVAATGNPMLYRVSTGHEGVLCESCHGATHAIFPNANPKANDNVASIQLQGHAGMISECSTCHTGDLGNTLDGPHGMHAVGSAGKHFAEGGHADQVENNSDSCRACHGKNGEGTPLSAMFTDRVLQCDDKTAICTNGESQLFPKGHQVTCTDCHENEL